MKPAISFEFFAPKSIDAAFRLSATVDALKGFSPEFISITCGTGGGSANLTDETVSAIKLQTNVPIFAHMTCGSETANDIMIRSAAYRAQGMTHVVALRGDTPANAPHETDISRFPSVSDFVGALAAQGLGAYVAAYPEIHPKAETAQQDLDVLKAKQDAGAVGAITQFFFEAETFLRFRDKCVQNGITLELVPGILPVSNWAGTAKMAAQCGASVSCDLAEGFARAHRENRSEMMAIAHGTEMCDKLVREGVDHLHFYTMNRVNAVASICAALGLTYHAPLREVA